MKVHFKNSKEKITFDQMIEKYSFDEFRSPFRSTISLILFVKSEAFTNFQEITEIYSAENDYYFEYKVPIQKGQGNASHTDLMITNPNKCIAIEAKNTESKYTKVENWNNSENKRMVLNGWLNLINTRTSGNISIKEIGNIAYQMIHRLASACVMQNKEPEMMYLYFSNNEEMEKYYIEQLRMLRTITGEKIRIGLYKIKSEKTILLKDLEKEWREGARDLSQKVIKGIQNSSLYVFNDNNFTNLI